MCLVEICEVYSLDGFLSMEADIPWQLIDRQADRPVTFTEQGERMRVASVCIMCDGVCVAVWMWLYHVRWCVYLCDGVCIMCIMCDSVCV